MNPITLLIGLAAIAYGCTTLVLRQKNSTKLGKLEAMKKQWGETAGYVVHLVAYSVIPIVFGISMVFAGLRGVSLF